MDCTPTPVYRAYIGPSVRCKCDFSPLECKKWSRIIPFFRTTCSGGIIAAAIWVME